MAFEVPRDFHTVNPATIPPPDSGVFEFGLTLAGTVSAGAYTAGFVDFLIEALDQYYAHGLANGKPPHKVVLRVISGTSGGSLVAAQAGRALYRDFAPMPFRGSEITGRDNLFYNTWVNGIDISDLLDNSDLVGLDDIGDVASLLNSDKIDRLGYDALSYKHDAPKLDRHWVADPLDIVLTEFNMRGVPYRVPYAEIDGSLRYQSFMDHADHVRFQIMRKGNRRQLRNDAFAVVAGAPAYDRVYAEAAMGSAAFPIGLKSRVITRPLKHYLYRGRRNTRETADGTFVEEYMPLGLDPEILDQGPFISPDQEYDFVAVDGGVTTTEPVEFARTTLAGIQARNPRAAEKANRAVVLVAPLFSPKRLPIDPPLNDEASGKLLDILKTIVPSMRNQALFSSAAMQLAGDDNVHSRFLVLPSRKRRDGTLEVGDGAIAATGLGAFLGFMDIRYRRHDYRLGRHNAWLFLKDEFLLQESNPLFDNWSEADRKKQRSPYKGTHFLPIVPLVGTAKDEPTVQPWPTGGIANRDRMEASLRRRAEMLLDLLPLEGRRRGGWDVRWLAASAAIEVLEEFAERTIMKMARRAIDKTLKDKALE